ncbi:glycosyl transferase [Microbacterium sp. M28]|uniref:glycosyl transferase n=1 Tax=Microbacterium sp. M28 TaxID=2962064 RepID=UPI0021F4C8AC|nr:glycosyl transferase [Microbacterium sp. M28]UYO98484.1 glycosyl transferase [Microbacterium sp. M28]
MRFVWAVVAFVLATLLIGAGIAQRTLFMGPSSEELVLETSQPEPYTLIDGAVLRTQPGLQSLIIRGDGELFAAYGRTADMEAWLSDATYNSITLKEDGTPETTVVEPELAEDEESTEEPTPAPTEEPAEPAAGRNPAGSDLWLDSFTEQDQIITDMQLPEGTSILIARDGTEPAPDDIVVSWPLDNSTPLAGPLMATGGLMLAIGVVLYILGIRHQRRGRGPRRKGLGPMPPTEPIDVAIDRAPEREAIEPAPASDAEAGAPSDADSEATGATEQNGTTKRVAVTRRRLAIPALALVAALATGCSADSWPQFGAETATPSPTPTVIAPENQKPPAVTEAQAARILQNVSETVAQADTDLDIDLAATRLDGAALTARRTDYKLRGAIADRPVPAVIPTDKVEILLPQATDAWPRTVLMLSKSDADDSAAPVILTMTQQDPWSDYKVSYLADMQASVELPELAPPWAGTTLVPPDTTFLALAPTELAAAFSDVVDAGDKSASYDLFDDGTHELAAKIQTSRQSVVDNLAAKQSAETAKAAFGMDPATDQPVSMATLDSGAIVAVSVLDSETITPTSADAVIKFGEDPVAKALTGVDQSAKGVKTTYSMQLFFSVPTQVSGEQIRLLAVHQDVLNVEVIK